MAAAALSAAPLPAQAANSALNPVYGPLALEAFELTIQILYISALLVMLGTGAFLVLRQVLVRRELETASKDLQEEVRLGQASPEALYELGAVLLRKKQFVQANKYLEQAILKWEGPPAELSQVYNALGFSYFNQENLDRAIASYEKAVKLAPAYVVGWNNLGNAYEGKKELEKALQAYEQVLRFDPNNKVARELVPSLKERIQRRVTAS